MKILIVALVSSFLNLPTAHAAANASRLSYEFGPMYQLHHLPVGARTLSSIQVKTNGNVVFYRASISGLNGKGKIIAKLNAYEMDGIEDLIDRASRGKILTPTILCAAVPNETRNYRADRNLVILSVGAEPCGNEKYNRSRAAYALIEQLNKLRILAESKTTSLMN